MVYRPTKILPTSLSDLQNPSRPTPVFPLQFHLSLLPHPYVTGLMNLLPFHQVLCRFTCRPLHMLFPLTGAFFLSPLPGKPTLTHPADFSFKVTFSRWTSLNVKAVYFLGYCFYSIIACVTLFFSYLIVSIRKGIMSALFIIKSSALSKEGAWKIFVEWINEVMNDSENPAQVW